LIPESHKHLLEGSVDVILTTISKKGNPHSSMIWSSFDGENILLNTGVGYQKERNMRRNPNVSVFAYDPKTPEKWISVSGTVELVSEDAIEHLNRLCYKYTGLIDFHRDLMPELSGEERVIVKISPKRVSFGG
jgi:PPOX class probable F420-dependent enzyme